MLQKEAEGRKKEEEAVSSEVASPRTVEEPEPQVVAEPLQRTSGVIRRRRRRMFVWRLWGSWRWLSQE